MLKSNQLILRVYMSMSVSTWGHRLFNFHLWDDLRRHGNTMCGYMGPLAQWQLDYNLRRPSQPLRAATAKVGRDRTDATCATEILRSLSWPELSGS